MKVLYLLKLRANLEELQLAELEDVSDFPILIRLRCEKCRHVYKYIRICADELVAYKDVEESSMPNLYSLFKSLI